MTEWCVQTEDSRVDPDRQKNELLTLIFNFLNSQFLNKATEAPKEGNIGAPENIVLELIIDGICFRYTLSKIKDPQTENYIIKPIKAADDTDYLLREPLSHLLANWTAIRLVVRLGDISLNVDLNNDGLLQTVIITDTDVLDRLRHIILQMK